MIVNLLAVDYVGRFLDNPTWPGAIVISIAIIAIAWIIVTFIKMFYDN